QTPASPGAMLWRRLRLLLRGRGRPHDTIEPRCESLVDARHLKLPDKVRIGYRLAYCLCNGIKVLGLGLDERHDLRFCRHLSLPQVGTGDGVKIHTVSELALDK